jgi:23S rRNA (uracil1939-C5)-methyltransferase
VAVEAFEVDIESLNAAGDGVARDRGGDIIVPFTLPGERVRITARVARNGVRLGGVQAVIRASPHRVAPRCPHFGPAAEPGPGPCGGCSWQHIAYPEQLRLKSGLVTRLVRAAVPSAPDAKPMLPGARADQPWGYRQKVHFVFDRARGGLVMGHYVRGGRRVIPVRECPVHDERGNAVAFRFRDAFARGDIAAAPEGPLKSIAIRAGLATADLAATLVLTREADRRLRVATRRVLEGRGAPTSCHVNLHPRPDAFIFGPHTRTISGSERMRERVAEASFLLSPTAFFQTNVNAAGILAGLVRAAVPANSRVLDLYAGAGLFALPLALGGHQVVAVEENRQAVADGEASRRLNRIADARCTFIARRVEQALGLPATRGPFEVVILDPPREGCVSTVIDRVFGGIAAPLVFYISCNPEALARDLSVISRHRYTIRSMQPVDMFPHTAHVETLVTLAR